MTLMTLIRQLRTSSIVTCGRPPTPISRMLPACTGNCRRQCCGINLSEQPSLGASSQPRLRKAILEREAGQIMHMAPSVSLVVAVATLAAAAPTATVQLLRAATTVCKLNAGSKLATLASKSARLWFSIDVLETAWPWPSLKTALVCIARRDAHALPPTG